MCIVHLLRWAASALLCRYCWVNAERVGRVGDTQDPDNMMGRVGILCSNAFLPFLVD